MTHTSMTHIPIHMMHVDDDGTAHGDIDVHTDVDATSDDAADAAYVGTDIE